MLVLSSLYLLRSHSRAGGDHVAVMYSSCWPWGHALGSLRLTATAAARIERFLSASRPRIIQTTDDYQMQADRWHIGLVYAQLAVVVMLLFSFLRCTEHWRSSALILLINYLLLLACIKNRQQAVNEQRLRE